MATEYGNIDDMLMTGATPTTPPTPESKPDEYEPVERPDDVYGEPEPQSEPDEPEQADEPEEPEEPKAKEPEYDDYGNAKAPPKTYTEEEVNERINKAIRERLARGNNNGQGATPSAQEVAQKSQDFDYNPDSAESWETQLAKFVEKTVTDMGTKQAQEQQRVKDQQYQAEFEDRFSRGMDRFSDFRDVVAPQPITDPMTLALREMQDPAAFIYAASKRNPQELARIAALPSGHAQMMEMAKLEQSMRKQSPSTKAPKPVSRTRDDATMPTQNKKKEPTIEDLIANADAKRKAQLQQRRGR